MNTIRVACLTALCLFFTHIVFAQKTLSYDSTIGSPKASIENMAWMAGLWKGEAFGGYTEEVWTPPSASSMMFAFKAFSKGGEIQFYEFGAVIEKEGTLTLRFKHFHPDMKGWEGQNEYLDFKLVKVSSNKVYFDGFTFERINDQEVKITVVIESEGEANEMDFYYKKDKS